MAVTADSAHLGSRQLNVLRGFLQHAGEQVDGPLRARRIEGGRSNITTRLWTNNRSWVLRRPPDTGATPSAHDVAREARVVSALAASDVPVARTVGYTEDAEVLGHPFAIYEYVPGAVLRTQQDLEALSDMQVRAIDEELVRLLSMLHQIDAVAIGLERIGKPTGFMERQMRRWSNQWQLVSSVALPDMDRLQGRIADSLPSGNSASALVHGDFRIDNTIVDEHTFGLVRAVVDWEMSTLGDPLADLAMTLVYRHSAFDHVIGVPAASTSRRGLSTESLAQQYALRTGHDLGDLDAYLAFGYFKLAVIASGIQARAQGRPVGHDGFVGPGRAVPDLLSAGLAAAHH